jgi:hypothetical protein
MLPSLDELGHDGQPVVDGWRLCLFRVYAGEEEEELREERRSQDMKSADHVENLRLDMMQANASLLINTRCF